MKKMFFILLGLAFLVTLGNNLRLIIGTATEAYTPVHCTFWMILTWLATIAFRLEIREGYRSVEPYIGLILMILLTISTIYLSWAYWYQLPIPKFMSFPD